MTRAFRHPRMSSGALRTLLLDDDAASRELVRRQLVDAGRPALAGLRELLGDGDRDLTVRVRDIIAEIERGDIHAHFTEVCRRPDEFDMEDAVWGLARVFEPGADIARYRQRLDEWADEARAMIAPGSGATGRVGALSASLAERQGFSGNVSDYYSPSNSLLTSVMDSRYGNPIALCVLYMLVGQRAGIEVEGVNTPGHFLARHEGVYFDPFHGGRILPTGELRGIIERFEPEQVAAVLAPAGAAAILRRMMGNLEQIFRQAGDHAHADMLARWVLLLDRH